MIFKTFRERAFYNYRVYCKFLEVSTNILNCRTTLKLGGKFKKSNSVDTWLEQCQLKLTKMGVEGRE